MIRKPGKLVEIPKPLLQKMLKASPAQKEWLFELIKQAVHEEKPGILQQALRRGLFSKEEYDKEYKDRFYDDYGCDSFIQYINAVMDGRADRFVTVNHRIIKVRDQLERKFKLKVATPEEIMKMEKS